MRQPLRRNWTILWLILGGAAMAQVYEAASAQVLKDPGARRARHTEGRWARNPAPRWAPGSPWPLTEMERDFEGSRIESWAREPREPATPGIVSVRELTNPLSSDDKENLDQARKDLDEGRRVQGMRKLEAALERPETEAYALEILGIDSLKRRNLDEAVEFLNRSAKSLPNNASVHAHYAFALAAAGRIEHAEDEVRLALALRPNMPGAQYLLGVLLLNDPNRHPEAAQCLRAAQPSVPAASLALAVLYASGGKMDQMREAVGASGLRDEESWQKWVIQVASLQRPATAFGIHARH